MQSTQSQFAPDSYYCPITHNIMKNPVIDPDGNSYEREAILEWLYNNPVSPITRRALAPTELIPNRALKEIIENFLQNEQNVELTKKVDKIAIVSDKIQLKAGFSTNGNDLLVSLVPPEGTERTPLDICCVIDVSGSMGSEASVKTSSGNNESHGLSILDIVQHAVKTIIHALNENDRLGIVSFDSVSHSILNLTRMTISGRETAIKKLDELDADGSTNLWGGLKSGLDLLIQDPSKDRLKVVLLLTDGEPTIIPPRGHIPVLKSYLDDHKEANEYLIYTFGFGYSLDSKLLDEIATVGNGTYSFIPDCNFVGTVFINTMANLSTILASNVTFKLDFGDSPLPKTINVPGFTYSKSNNSININLGNVRFGQSRDVFLNCETQHLPITHVHVTYKDTSNKNELSQISTNVVPLDNNAEIEKHKFRQETVELLHKVITTKSRNDALSLVAKLTSDIKHSNVLDDEFIEALLKDIEGQITEALSEEEPYKKWGQHYLPSLAWAHKFQQCNNFKDFGVQKYGGKLFSIIQKEADQLFSELPPPKPKFNELGNVLASGTSSFSNFTYAPQPNFSMSTYNDQHGGCFDGNCLIEMFNGEIIRVKDVKKGQKIKGPDGTPCEIICVVKTIIPTSRTQLVEIGGLKITKWHPIRINGKWQFPININDAKQIQSNEIYTFVLDQGHIVKINSVECVTLGHNFTEDVVSHPYFGTDKIINDLKAMKGWESGLIQLGEVKRNQITGFIDGVNEVWYQNLNTFLVY